MKKGLKITLITTSLLVAIILLDTTQSIVFNNRPIIKTTKTYSSFHKKDIGIFVETNIYGGVPKRTHFKWGHHTLPIKENIDDIENNNSFSFYISKPESYNDTRFNTYYENNDKTIYLAGNIDEFYIVDNGIEETLKYYIDNTHQTLNDSTKSVTDKLNKESVLKDGGTTIYKSRGKDVTIIVYNTIDKNKDIFIGDYSMSFDNESMCRNT